MTTIRFEASECGPGCLDPGCHYMHGASWFVGDVSFETKREAEEFLANMNATENPTDGTQAQADQG